MGSMGPAMQVSLLLMQVFAIAFTLVFQKSAGYVVSSLPIEVGRSSPVHQGKSFQRNGPSPPKGSFSVVPPASHKAIKHSKGSHTRSPPFSLKHLAKNGFHSPATSPLWTFYRNHHARKKINGLAPAASHPAPPHAIEQDCTSIVCPKPLTITPPGLPCGCAWPMKIGLRLSVALDTFFPLVLELAEEIASGVVLKRSQVRILGANAATQQPEKTVVLIDLVPLCAKFDNTRAYLTYKRFWHKQVAINASFFGDYEVMYVRYPGLPPSPPSSVDGSPYSGHDINRRTGKLLGVEVPRRPHKYYLSGNVIAIIALSACAAVVFSSAVVCVLLFSCLSLAKPAGIAGSVIGSGSTSASFSFDYGVTFSSTDIEKATDNLSFTRVIGEGGSGRVYSGILEDGTQVAVKKIKRDDQQGHREFLVEVETLKHLHHRNVVKLIGICTEQHCRCLVYELIPNGSVASHLHGVGQKTAPLDWGARMKIALGAARGLAYLHEDSSPRVIHRDFKSSNILLEHDFTPKVSDFGLARTTLDEENRLISTRVMGTIGYVDPEYAMTGHLLVKSDVYSYGVVLLELLTGRKAVDLSQQPESLVEWAHPLLTSKEGLKSIIDSSLGSDVSESVAKVAAIASKCVQPKVLHRPSMGEVVQALKLASNECDKKGQVLVNELDIESRLSVTDFSFRWHSCSGPLRTGRRRPFWERIRELSRGSVSEHGFPFKLRPGSQ